MDYWTLAGRALKRIVYYDRVKDFKRQYQWLGMSLSQPQTFPYWKWTFFPDFIAPAFPDSLRLLAFANCPDEEMQRLNQDQNGPDYYYHCFLILAYLECLRDAIGAPSIVVQKGQTCLLFYFELPVLASPALPPR